MSSLFVITVVQTNHKTKTTLVKSRVSRFLNEAYHELFDFYNIAEIADALKFDYPQEMVKRGGYATWKLFEFAVNSDMKGRTIRNKFVKTGTDEALIIIQDAFSTESYHLEVVDFEEPSDQERQLMKKLEDKWEVYTQGEAETQHGLTPKKTTSEPKALPKKTPKPPRRRMLSKESPFSEQSVSVDVPTLRLSKDSLPTKAVIQHGIRRGDRIEWADELLTTLTWVQRANQRGEPGIRAKESGFGYAGYDAKSNVYSRNVHFEEKKKDQAWETTAPMWWSHTRLGSCVLEKKIYTWDGYSMTNYDPFLNLWSNMVNLNQNSLPTFHPSASAGWSKDGAAYRCGGLSVISRQDHRETARWDPREGRWVVVAPLNSKRSSHKVVQYEGKVWALGGISALHPLGQLSIERYDERANLWALEAFSLPVLCKEFVVTSLGV